MRALIATLALLAFGLLTVGCYRAPVMPPAGLLFTSIDSTLDPNLDRTQNALRRGEASSLAILGLFAFGDCSVSAAADDGNLGVVHHADYSYINVIGIYQKFTLIALGD